VQLAQQSSCRSLAQATLIAVPLRVLCKHCNAV
jgi:hypothetical protein